MANEDKETTNEVKAEAEAPAQDAQAPAEEAAPLSRAQRRAAQFNKSAGGNGRTAHNMGKGPGAVAGGAQSSRAARMTNKRASRGT